MNEVDLLDCTIRDGGYVNNWAFDPKLVRETYRALSKAGVNYVELGYHGTAKYFNPEKYGLFRFSDSATINETCRGISGAAVSLMVDHGKFDLADLAQYQGSVVKLIRLAFHKDKIAAALKSAAEIRQMGFKVSINLMGYSSYTEQERSELLQLLKKIPLDYVYVADTYGSMFPNQVAEFYGPLLKAVPGTKWGFHPHNNLQMAFANSLAAVEAGAQIIDSSVYGMGRGAGNLPTEIVLAYLQLTKPERYNAIPVLNLVDRYYEQLKKEHGWGYDLPYMLSGIYGCHPDYAKNLVERKEYSIEDIWSILGIIKANEPVGFKKELVENILRKGLFAKQSSARLLPTATGNSRKNQALPAYIGRHQNADFLIIANGPSIQAQRGKIEAFIAQNKPIVMAGNYIGGLFRPDYHAFNNKRRFVDYVGTVDPASKLLVGEYISEEMVREYADRAYERILYDDVQDVPFNIKDGVISANCRTIALLLMGVAITMGARRIFVVGLDGYMAPDRPLHFYVEKDEAADWSVISDKHLGNLNYLEQIDQYLVAQGKEGVHIMTPTNYTKFYKGIENYLRPEEKR